MRAVVQRVKGASVVVDDITVGEINQGLLVYLGVGKEDSEEDLDYIVNKILKLRIFDEKGKMNRSVLDINGDVLIVSQFTLYGSVKKGTRPSFNDAGHPEIAEKLYELAKVKISQTLGKTVQCGIFGADIGVSSVNDGPVTILLNTEGS